MAFLPFHLKITAPLGSSMIRFGNGVSMPPVAEFIGVPTTGTTPLAVTFTDQSTGAVEQWLWNFGDGQTSASQNPSHVYAAAGTYTVALTVMGPGGSNTKVRPAYVLGEAYVEPPPPASYPAWLTAGVGQWAAIANTAAGHMLRDFSGLAFADDGASSVRMISGLGGGHAGNVLYNSMWSIDLAADAPAWTLLRGSGDPAGYDSATMTYFPADGTPGPRHLYNSVVYWPDRNTVLFGGTFWARFGSDNYPTAPTDGFSLSTNDWEAPSTYTPRTRGEEQWGDFSVYHPATGYVYCARQRYDNELKVGYKLAPDGTRENWHSASGIPISTGPGAADTRRNAIFYFGKWSYLTSTGAQRSVLIDAVTGAKTEITFSPTAAKAAYDTVAGYAYLSPGMAYDKNADCYHYYSGADNPALGGQNNRVYQIFATENNEWAMGYIQPGGVTVPNTISTGGDYSGSFALGFVDRWRALLLPRNKNNNIHYLRLPFSTMLKVRSGATAGLMPYTASLMPPRGEMPAGHILQSDDDATLSTSVLNTYDDGSAMLVVVSGAVSVSANATRYLHVRAVPGVAGAPITTSRIGSLVSSVEIDFTAAYGGAATITDFSAPETVWWANERMICARYRVPAPAPGSTALEAVVDITAWGSGHDRAQVEVMIENGKFNAATSTLSSKPASAVYTDATVKVNGTTIATVSTTSTPSGIQAHRPFRSWYVRGWVGGDPGLRVTQRHQDLQRHPMFWRMDKASAIDFDTSTTYTYRNLAYTPWTTGLHRGGHPSCANPAEMRSGGTDWTIGPLTLWDAQALQTGNHHCWNAAEVNALAMLAFNINCRDSVTGAVPHAAVMPFKTQVSSHARWPYDDDVTWGKFEHNHPPAAGLMGFLSRPSPVFIEIAQRIAVWGATRNYVGAVRNPAEDITGYVFVSSPRQFAWALRNLTHATFLSPSVSPWQAGGREWLRRTVTWLNAKVNAAPIIPGENTHLIWNGWPNQDVGVDESAIPGRQTSPWMHNYATVESHKLAASHVIVDETVQSYAESWADWIAESAVKFINELPSSYRFVTYRMSYQGADGNGFANMAAARANDITGSQSEPTEGPWRELGTENQVTWTSAETYANTQTTADVGYETALWAALCMAVERQLPGALTAWQTVTGINSEGRRVANPGITNLDTWRLGFANSPRWGTWPRNI